MATHVIRKKTPPRSTKTPWLKTASFIFTASLPVAVYVWRFAITNRNGIFHGEDWDEFAQMYEAARITILHYHQFPWWNPWSVGGEPLFANPQFGLISIQMPLVLLFGTVAGLHYSMFAYFILGFWGMYLFLRHIAPEKKLLDLLLSYIWVFSGFPALHLSGGHLTFAVYLLAPWAFLALLNIEQRLGWLWFGLVASFLLLTAVHYLTLETLLVCGIIAGVRIVIKIRANKDSILPILLPYIYALGLILLLCGVKMFYTLQLLHEYPKLESLDPAESLNLFSATLAFRHPVDTASLSIGAPYGWTEYGDYVGIITLGLLAYVFVTMSQKVRSWSYKDWLLVVSIIVAATYTLGSFSAFSPYVLMHHLPIFNQMRVPYRFICWVVFGIILFLVKLPKRPLIYALLVISVADVFAANYAYVGYPQARYIPPTQASAQFEQYSFFDTNPALGQSAINSLQNFRLFRATQSNYGEVYGYEPILNLGEYYFSPGTARCGINQGCQFVMSHNATVTSWSPNRIVLHRTGNGPIELNMNPGKVWRVNGQAIFNNERVLELQKRFVITNPASQITVSYTPVLR